MLITTKSRYIKKHIIGGAGIFDTIANIFKRVTGSTAAKAIASKLGTFAKTEIGKKAIEAGKTTAREVGLKAIDVGKDVAIAKAKALIDGFAPKNQETIRQLTNNHPVRSAAPALTQKSKDALAALINMNTNEAECYATTNINKFLAGSGVGTKASAISIQDLVKRLNTGSGLRLA